MTTDNNSPPIDDVRSIEDPLDRARAVADVLVPARARLRAARSKRDLAAIALAEQHGVPPVTIYREMGVSRGLFDRVRRRAPAELPKVSRDRAWRDLRAAVRDITADAAVVDQWRPLRDDTIWQLFAAHPELSNADIGRLFGVRGQRITIMRTQGR